MDLLDCAYPTAAVPPGHDAGSRTRVLADALAHVLGRDDDRPARWHTAAFAAAVDRARAELRGIASVSNLRIPSGERSGAITFDEAVERIARNPADVAAAIRRLELSARQPLPAWPELVRRGLPPRPSDLDVALWFG